MRINVSFLKLQGLFIFYGIAGLMDLGRGEVRGGGGGGSKRNFEIKSGEIAGVTRSPEGGHTPKIIFVGHYVTKIGKLGGGVISLHLCTLLRFWSSLILMLLLNLHGHCSDYLIFKHKSFDPSKHKQEDEENC